VTAIQEFPAPNIIKQLQQFLGMINFYRRFLPRIAATLQPLTDLLRGNPNTLEWTASAADAFTAAKAALVATVLLSHPAPGATLALAVDASDSHVGGVLQQLENRAWRPLAFFSQKLTPTQVRFSTLDRELLAASSSVRHFRFLLEGRKFRILTDHKTLVSATTSVLPPWSNRQQRHLSFLAEFTSDLRHTSGSSNVVADTLSCPPTNSASVSAAAVSCSAPTAVVSGSGSAAVVSASGSAAAASGSVSGSISAAAAVGIKPPAIARSKADLHASKLSAKPLPPTENNSSVEPLIAAVPAQPQLEPEDFAKLAAAQTSCPDVVSMSNSPSLNIISRPVGDVQLLGDISTGIFRPLVPAAFREQIIRSLHSVHHPGIRATARLIKASFCWPRDGERHHGGGSHLHGLSAGEGAAPCNTGTGTHSCPPLPLLTCTCGFSGPATKVCRIHPPIHSHGSQHQVARSNPVVIHRRRRLCSRTLHRLDTTVWGALYNHQRQRATIYISAVGSPLQASEHQPHPYNSVPSAIQWIG
jgi:hypothetical protein